MSYWVISRRRFRRLVVIMGIAGLAVSGVLVSILFPDLLGRAGSSTASETAAPSTLATLSPPAAGSGGEPINAEQIQTVVQVGQPAPDFTLPTLGGGTAALSDFKGQPVLINFWASWCAPCRLEMPDLVQAYKTYKGDDFVILAVNLTFQDSVEGIIAFTEEFNMTFPILLDEKGEVFDLYYLRGLPMSFFVDRAGVVRRMYIGAMAGEQIDQFVEGILE